MSTDENPDQNSSTEVPVLINEPTDIKEGGDDIPLLDDTEKLKKQSDACDEESDKKNKANGDGTEQTIDSATDSQIINEVGRDAIFTSYNTYYGTGHKGHGNEKNLLNFLEKLPPRSPDMPKPTPEEIDTKLQDLRRRRIIFVSCPNEGIALAMSHALIEGLAIDDKDKWLLEFDLSGVEDSDRTINLFMPARKKANSEAAILVDMRSNSEMQFLDSLTHFIKPGVHEGAIRSSVLEGALNRNRYFLIGMVRPEHVETRLRHLKYPYWEVDFLRHMLGDYAHLEQRILDQRSCGKWDKDDEQFCRDIEIFVSKRQIEVQVELRENFVEESLPEHIFKGDDCTAAADLISNTVLYTATFFPALNPGDFKQVVGLLLGERTVTVTTTAYRQTSSGVKEPFEEQREEPLKKTWDASSDKILKLCKLKSLAAKDSTRTICFSEPCLKERLKVYIEEEYSFFLEDHFQMAQRQGLLFHNSPDVSEAMRRLIVEMTLSYRDHFDQHWLIEVITKLKEAASQQSDGQQTPAPELKPFLRIQGGRLEFCYTRIAELLRDMLWHAPLRGLVDEFLNRLIGVEFYDSVLQIVAKLQFAPEFDLLYWVKQLLDRRPSYVRHQTYVFLVLYLMRAGPSVYESLRVIRHWLPSPDSDHESYSVTNLCALELIFRYCHEATLEFSVNYYGFQPSSFPLFAGDNISAIEDNSKLLAEWLFHPEVEFFAMNKNLPSIAELLSGIKPVLNKDVNLTISTLIVNWMFILIGPNKDAPAGQSGLTSVEDSLQQAEQAQSNRDLPVSNGLILGLFLRAVATKITQSQMEELSVYWKVIAELMTQSIEGLPYTGNLRQERVCIRNLARDLARQFKGFARNVKAQTTH